MIWIWQPHLLLLNEVYTSSLHLVQVKYNHVASRVMQGLVLSTAVRYDELFLFFLGLIHSSVNEDVWYKLIFMLYLTYLTFDVVLFIILIIWNIHFFVYCCVCCLFFVLCNLVWNIAVYLAFHQWSVSLLEKVCSHLKLSVRSVWEPQIWSSLVFSGAVWFGEIIEFYRIFGGWILSANDLSASWNSPKKCCLTRSTILLPFT